MHVVLQELHMSWDMTAPIFASISQLQRLQSLRIIFQVCFQAPSSLHHVDLAAVCALSTLNCAHLRQPSCANCALTIM